MKFLVFFTVFLLSVHLSLQVPKLVNCSPEFVLTESRTNSCGVITCNGPQSFIQIGCAQSHCAPGKQLGYIESDNTKLFPECCSRPICSD